VSLLKLLSLGSLILAVVLVSAGWFVFVPRLPAPTGPSAVIRSEATIRDASGAPLAITIWQPRELNASTPLILYSPGWGGTRTQSQVQVENLASHGFVVVGCDDLTSDPATDPDRGVSLELQSDAETTASIARAGRHAVTQGNRLLDVLAAFDAGQVPALAGRLSLAHVGVLGYSMGGTSGLAAAAKDQRIVAVFNIDGGLFGPAADEIAPQAYFLLSSEEAFPSEADLASSVAFTRNYAKISALDIPRNKHRMEQPQSYWVQLPAASHGDLSDGLFARPHRFFGRTNFERWAMNGAIEKLEVAFFRSALLGDRTPLESSIGRNDQTVRWISPTSPSAAAAKARQ
jgi:dienelactone hydrolase